MEDVSTESTISHQSQPSRSRSRSSPSPLWASLQSIMWFKMKKVDSSWCLYSDNDVKKTLFRLITTADVVRANVWSLEAVRSTPGGGRPDCNGDLQFGHRFWSINRQIFISSPFTSPPSDNKINTKLRAP